MNKERFIQDQEMFESLWTAIADWTLPEGITDNEKQARLAILANFVIRANEFGQDGVTLDPEGHVAKVWTDPDD